MKQGIIDIGSNTVRLVVYKVDGREFESIVNEKHYLQLIGYIKKGKMSVDGEHALINALKDLRRIADHIGLDGLRCFATQPFRAVRDAEALAARVREQTGLKIDILQGEEEARLGVQGARHHNGVRGGLFVDLGGGSLEASLVREDRIAHTGSVDVGSASLANRFVTLGFPTNSELSGIKRLVDEKLEALDWLDKAGETDVFFMGGTARAMFSMHSIMNGSFIPAEEYAFHASEIKNLYKAVLKMKIGGLRLLAKHCPGRLFTFVPGVVALSRVVRKAKVKTAHLSAYGVREGFLVEKLLVQ